MGADFHFLLGGVGDNLDRKPQIVADASPSGSQAEGFRAATASGVLLIARLRFAQLSKLEAIDGVHFCICIKYMNEV